MNRTLTATVALAAALGMAGLAQAQTNPTPSTSPMTTAPSATQPGMSGTTGTPNPATMSAPASTPSSTGPYGAQPQANTQSTNPNVNQAAINQGMQPVTQSQILQAQRQLKSAGLYRGTVDGMMGRETQTAISQFQREQGLPQTAQLDQQTLDKLMNPSGGGTGAAGMQPNGSTGASTGTQPNTTSGMNRNTQTTPGPYSR